MTAPLPLVLTLRRMPRTKSLLRTILEPLAVAVALAAAARSVVHVYSIPSESMAPALRTGDHILVTRYLAGTPGRGDVVVFAWPPDGSELMVKRIVGLPGDLVDARLGRLRIGGYTLPEPYVLRAATTGAIEPHLVPAGSFFVLGDNREESVDSRVWGPIPASAVVGRARMVLWSSEAGGDPVRAAVPGDARRRREPAGDTPRLFKWIE